MSQREIEILQRALKREKEARKQSERILEDKSRELYIISSELQKANHQLEYLLDETTSQLKGVFENIIDAYVVIDLKGNFLKMNDAATKLFGFEISDKKRNVLKLLYKEDYAYGLKTFKQLTKTGIFRDYKTRIYSSGGKVKWVNLNASIIYDKEKKPIAAQGIVRDIDRAQKNVELIEKQKREYSIIVDNSFYGIFLTSEGKIQKTNEAMRALLGYSEDELNKLFVKEIISKEDYPETEKNLKKMKSGEIDSFVTRKRFLRKNGSTVWVKSSVNAVRDSSGNLKNEVTITEDITVERERTLMLETINNVARSLVGKIDLHEIAHEITKNISEYLGSKDCVIYMVDRDSGILNPIASTEPNHMVNKAFLSNIRMELHKGIVGSVANSGKEEIIDDTRLDDRYLVGVKRRLSEITVPIIAYGKVIGVIDAEHDRKNYYTKGHLATLKNIARLVGIQFKNAINLNERRIAEESNKELLIKLEKSNQELQDYAHIVSHDLKSPLRSISALISWIKEDYSSVIDFKVMKHFEHIDLKLEKMDHLISGILSYSSIDEQHSSRDDVDVNEIIHNIINIILLPPHIEINIKKPLPIIKADSIRIQQLFQNIISNAVRHIDKEKGFIDIDVTEKDKFYQFSIKDNGVGIAKEYHEKIFKIFSTLKNDKESTGIGLSIVKKILNLYEGQIWVESEVGKGATFYFTIKKS